MHERNPTLIDSLYLSTFRRQGWSEVLRRAAKHLNCVGMAIAVLNPDRYEKVLFEFGGVIEAACDAYGSNFIADDPRIPRLLASGDTMRLDSDLLNPGERAVSPLYNELLDPLGIGQTLLARLDIESNLHSVAIFCRLSSAGVYTATEFDHVSGLLPHLSAALRLRLRLGAKRDSTARGRNDDPPLFVLDGRRNILEANEPALSLVDRHSVFNARGGRLQGNQTAVDDVLVNLVAGMHDDTRKRRPSSERRVERIDCACGCPLTAVAVPVQHTTMADRYGPSATVLLLLEDDHHKTVNEHNLHTVYGMAPMQARVAAYIAQGYSLSETAALLKVSRNTAKTHLRGAFEKTGTNSQGELCAVINRQLAAFAGLL